MSEIKVNKISPRTACGTTTLGDSGDTFTIPAGVSITNSGTASGFGATGSASWNTTVKTTDFTAVTGEGYFVNTTSGEVDVTLPAGTAGAVIAVKDYANTWDTDNCILISNGSEKIGGSTNNAILATQGLAVTLVYIDAVQGWLITDDGLQSYAVTNPYIVATGGTITTCGNDKIHTFTGPGTFSVASVALAAANNVVSYLAVAGGGGSPGMGGGCNGGGGGGGGGFREGKSPVTPYTSSPAVAPTGVTVTATDYPITVGAGGTAGPASSTPTRRGTPGGVSTFSIISSAGGGVGGHDGCRTGDTGGSGGGTGGGGNDTCRAAGNTPPVSPPQGNPGGNSPQGPPDAGAGGGGGACAAGQDGSGAAGNGGAGLTTSINGTPTARSGGGGGGASTPQNTAGTGGTGGGGAGGTQGNEGVAGTTNTGGGGGSPGGGSGPTIGRTGGSGIVIIRYKYQ